MDLDQDSIESDLLISLGSAPTPTPHGNSLADKITRINSQRADLGGFRTLTEESLREEIAEQNTTIRDGIELDTSSSEDEEFNEPDRIKELANARQELLGQIESTHQSAMLALDFVSLCLSKDMPNQAIPTVSPELQELVGIGTLGIDKLVLPKTTEVDKQENQKIATGWQAQSLNKTVDSILASATRLEKEIELETRYWEKILDVSKNNWAICRLPSEKQTLGVRIGFSEASSAFQGRSLAALRRKPDGSVYLDQGLSESEPQAIRVRLHTSGNETGSTVPPPPLPNNAPVEDFILQAQNTIFAEELWQEMQREARNLLAFGVSSSFSAITIILTPTKTAIIDLIPLSSNSFLSSSLDDYLAQFIHNALHLNLSWVHRQARRRRAQAQPSINSNMLPEPYSLIRPLLTRLAHEHTVNGLTDFLYPLTITLGKASISASYTVKRTSLPISTSLSKSEQVLNSLTAHLETVIMIKLLPGTELTLITRTSTNRDMIPIFQIQVNNESFVNTTCPPPTVFHKVDDVREWVFWCTSCALTYYTLEYISKVTNEQGWYLSAKPNVLRREFSGLDSNSTFISSLLDCVKDSSTQKQIVRLRVSWEKKVRLQSDNDNCHGKLADMIDGSEKKQDHEWVDFFDWVTLYGKKNEKFNSDSEKWELDGNLPIKSLLEVVSSVWGLTSNIESENSV